ncbi:hypothetical protein JTB14_028883 [Gonioctena quinquepunctata]|nr:hypothetical protein JTB14_028883 [Gonioctena quinquepunctata]
MLLLKRRTYKKTKIFPKMFQRKMDGYFDQISRTLEEIESTSDNSYSSYEDEYFSYMAKSSESEEELYVSPEYRKTREKLNELKKEGAKIKFSPPYITQLEGLMEDSMEKDRKDFYIEACKDYREKILKHIHKKTGTRRGDSTNTNDAIKKMQMIQKWREEWKHRENTEVWILLHSTRVKKAIRIPPLKYTRRRRKW